MRKKKLKNFDSNFKIFLVENDPISYNDIMQSVDAPFEKKQ